jgi:hypothetical protein
MMFTLNLSLRDFFKVAYISFVIARISIGILHGIRYSFFVRVHT